MSEPMSPEELRACRERAEAIRSPAVGYADRVLAILRFFDADVPRLLATIAARDARLEAVRSILAEADCDCDRDHREDECDDECDHGDPCLVCRIEAAMKGGVSQ